VGVQAEFWNDWNIQNRMRDDLDDYQQRLVAHAQSVILGLGKAPRIIEVGCGTGWLSNGIAPLGSLFGVDLSSTAVEVARRRCLTAEFEAGDFLTMPIPGPFDFAVSADTLAHVPNQPAFVSRVASLLCPGGTFLLMSQNPFVWRRSSYVARADVPGYVRYWPSVQELHRMLEPHFDVLHTTSLAPGGGDVGVMRWLNGRWGWGALSRVIGRKRVAALYERVLLGRELAIVARRRAVTRQP
jgi:SAM-dependent methyltransferase